MVDTPFFRGRNRFDWLFACTLQSACDWGTLDEVQQVAAILGTNSATRYTDTTGIFPAVTVVELPDFLFVVSASTKSTPQWFGNVLGSASLSVPPSGGEVSAYFGACATFQLAATAARIRSAASQGKSIVLIGFSLGGASVTILKDMILRQYGISSACVAMASPRAGTTSFTIGYPTDNFAGFMLVNDVVPSVPPVTWASLGIYNYWTPFPPFVTYAHPVAGTTLLLDGSMSDGYQTMPVSDVILDLNLGLYAKFHNQAQYAFALRKLLPGTLGDGFDGYPNAGSFDSLANSVFAWNSEPWPWPLTQPLNNEEMSSMTVQSTVYIRNNAGPALGPREVYYFNSTDPQAVNNNWLSTWLGYRAAFLSKSCEIYAVRSALVGGTKKSYLKKLIQPIQGVKGVTEDIEASIVIFGFNSDRSAKRQFHFRGIDSNWITQDQLTNSGVGGLSWISGRLTFPFIATPTAFLDALMAGGLSIYLNTNTIPNGFPITAAAKPTQDSLITLTVGNAYNPPVGTLVEITGCRQAPLMNAVWQTAGPQVSGSITLQGSSRFSCPATLTGVIRTRTLLPAAITALEYNGISSKKTGKPSFLQRGRQSAKLRRR